MAKVAIIGYGYVGKAYHKVFPDAVIHDLDYNNKDEINSCNLAIICVPTPTAEDGSSCDTSSVEEIFNWLTTPLILIKSTIKPGTTDMLQNKFPLLKLAFSPEYVSEGGYFVQFWNYPHPTDPTYHDFMIIGGEKKTTSAIVDIFIKKMGPHVKFMQTNAKTAEFIKYMENFFFATKITFVNEMYECAKAIGVDYNEVREGWLMDPRVNRNHTAVFPEKRGFEGKCLPKDTKAFIASAKDAGYEAGFLKSVLENNNRIRDINGFEKV